MRTTRGLRWLALLLTLALVLAACGGRDDDDDTAAGGGGETEDTTEEGGGEEGGALDTSECLDYKPTEGVTDTEIKIGSSFPQSGTFAAFATISKGFKAFFAYANEELDGVDGRKINLVTKDDGYDPSRTKSNIDGLIQEDKVFALFNVIGTPNNLSFWDDTEEQCVPNLYAGTGAPNWGDPEHTWTIGSIPSYTTEANVFVDYLKENKPEAKIAILYQNDDFGKSYLDALKAAIEGTDITIVKEETYEPTDPSVDTQITNLAASDADTFFGGTTALKCPQAMDAVNKAGWKPTVYMSQTCTSKILLGLAQPAATEGVLSVIYFKDPNNPQWDNDEAVKLYKEKVAKYQPGEDVTNGLIAYGWIVGNVLYETLKQAPELTRQAVMETALSLDLELPILLPGVKYTTGEGDKYPIESLQFMKYNSQSKVWELQGDVISFEGKTKFEA